MGCCLSMKLNHELNAKNNEMDYFSFDGITTKAKVVDIYDGDTCSVVFRHNGKYIKYRTRALGYDTSEIRPLKSIADRENVIAHAKYQKEEFTKLVMQNNGIITIDFHKFEKYGRILATYYIDNNLSKSINTIMIEKHGAKPYFGGKK